MKFRLKPDRDAPEWPDLFMEICVLDIGAFGSDKIPYL